MLGNFAETLRSLRTENNISQQLLADKLFVDRSTVAGWETGRRVPDIPTLKLIAELFNVEFSQLISDESIETSAPNVMLVDDDRIILNGCTKTISDVLPNAILSSFTRSSEAISFAKENSIALALLDIELGSNDRGGLDLCKELLKINPDTNVIFLTAYPDYALKAWDTGACGFLLKPLNKNDLKRAFTNLRKPLPFLTGN